VELHSRLRPWVLAFPGLFLLLAVVLGTTVAAGGVAEGERGAFTVIVAMVLLAGVVIAGVQLASRLHLRPDGLLSVNRVLWRRQVDLSRLREVRMSNDSQYTGGAVNRRPNVHTFTLLDDQGGKLSLFSLEAWDRWADVFAAIRAAAEAQDLPMSGMTREVLDEMSAGADARW
jgi:hypothetical protein